MDEKQLQFDLPFTTGRGKIDFVFKLGDFGANLIR